MTEESTIVSLSISNENININVQSNSWIDIISGVSEVVVKTRIFSLLKKNIGYIPEIGGWFPFVPESLSEIKDRILLALLLTYPNRILRPVVSAISSVKAGSLANYLTKEDLGVIQNTDENKEGICLNKAGCVLTLQLLEALENEGDELVNE
ncbi:MAG: hypothetical protein RTV31_16090 [Candidatus Thorarchaeota archaeon]